MAGEPVTRRVARRCPTRAPGRVGVEGGQLLTPDGVRAGVLLCDEGDLLAVEP